VRALTLSLLALWTASCNRDSVRVERIAILTFENLSADGTEDWVGRVTPFLVSWQTAGAKDVLTAHYDQARDAFPLRPTAVLRGYYTAAGGKIRLQAVLEDAVSHKTRGRYTAEAPVGDAGKLADVVARTLTAEARPSPPTRPGTLKGFSEALASTDPQAAAARITALMEADSGFAPLYPALAQLLAAHGDGAGVEKVIERARGLGEKLPAFERAQLEVIRANVAGEPARALDALMQLAALKPADTNLPRQLGEAYQARHDFQQSITWFRKASALEPREPLTWNALAYSLAYAGDFNAAIDALNQYKRLAPNEANPFDSMGEVELMAGRFSEAEQRFLEANQKNPAFLNAQELYRAAYARLLGGNAAGADELFAQYQGQLRNDPLRGLKQAQWDWLAGRGDKALAGMGDVAKSENKELASRASAYLTVWLLERGDRAGARARAENAAALAGSPGSAATAVVCKFITEPAATSSDWAVRAERAFPDPRAAAFKRAALGMALLYDQHFEAAVPLYREIYRETAPSNWDAARVPLAWALVEQKKVKDAEPLLRWYPMAPAIGDSPFAAVYFPRARELRGRVGLAR
jgi:tetratricopeptide (TPR) repeat protein